ncbi:hypothetical protein [Bradyrhizobium japonicum]|uniref:hypothetical protein n=1 Tax=Bradyrhizobium japonicum TaxID=375 RepID=UPI0004073460|nr:hypothetical protein [Bradyrhizobium japonicum]WLB91320.1 hypothetical protein QIH91_13410 [Bradyrhizobium japonicum USDA 135]
MPAPRDGYEAYYLEKLWHWIPATYRTEDGRADNPGVLRAIMEIMGERSAVARRSVDRLREDPLIEFADDWAVPYIGALVVARLLGSANRRGQRVDVANTIYYRRRAGTLPVLDMLIRDIAGWDGVVVEAFRRIVRAPHRLDPPLVGGGRVREGAVTGTPPGGFVDLRRTRGAEVTDGPYDDYSYLPDVRRLRGRLGRINIPKLNVHLYRQLAFAIELATPFAFADDKFTFDPSGRDTPLFSPSIIDSNGTLFDPTAQAGGLRRESSVDACQAAAEWNVTRPISCRLLQETRYKLPLLSAPVPQATRDKLLAYVGCEFVGESELRDFLNRVLGAAPPPNVLKAIFAAAATPVSPRHKFIPPGLSAAGALQLARGPNLPADLLTPEDIGAGNLEDWGTTIGLQPGKLAVVDPQRGHIWLSDAITFGKLHVPLHHIGMFGPIGAGTYNRRGSANPAAVDIATTTPAPPAPTGWPLPLDVANLPTSGVVRFPTNGTYRVGAPGADLKDLTLLAADRRRPYVTLIGPGTGDTYILRAAVPGAGEEPRGRDLLIDGLWLACAKAFAAEQVLTATPKRTTLALEGHFRRVVLRHCTLDPGGTQAVVAAGQVTPLAAFALELRGEVEELVIEQCVTGPIREAVSAIDPCSAGAIVIRDSIVQSLSYQPAIETRIAAVTLERSTVFGDVVVNRLDATEALIDGLVRVTDNQHGCFRFSATIAPSLVPTKPGYNGRLPRQYESQLFEEGLPANTFVSKRFGDPGYAQLADCGPAVLKTGAENGSEIGAWCRMLASIRLRDLTAKFAEYMPFGAIAQFINET